jgi:AAA15 family ATPase/GTPase
MNQTGQGFSKLFSLFCRMLVSKAEVLFIDEIENGLYYEAMPQIWRGIAALAASEGIQVFATTHSRECIVAAHETLKATADYDFAFHRIQRVKGRLEAITHDQEMLDTAIKSGLEVR